MANDTTAALGNALTDLVKERQQKEVEVKRLQEAVARAQDAEQDAQGRAKCADYELRAIDRDLEALLSLHNSSVEKSKAVQLRIEKLQKDRMPVFDKSRTVHESVQGQEQTLRDAKTRLAVAQEAYEDLQAQHRELTNLLQQESNKL